MTWRFREHGPRAYASVRLLERQEETARNTVEK
jgi:hypothetical protein